MVGRAAHLEKEVLGAGEILLSCYVVGYPDFNDLMALCINGISLTLTAGMPHLYFFRSGNNIKV